MEIDWKWAVGSLIAAFSAGIGAYQAYLKRQESRQTIAVKLTFAMLGRVSLPRDVLMIEVGNHGARPLTFSGSFALRIKGSKKTVALISPEATVRFPHKLEPGNGFSAWQSASDFSKAVRAEGYTDEITIQAVAKDASGGEWFSNWYTVNLRLDYE